MDQHHVGTGAGLLKVKVESVRRMSRHGRFPTREVVRSRFQSKVPLEEGDQLADLQIALVALAQLAQQLIERDWPSQVELDCLTEHDGISRPQPQVGEEPR